MNFINIITPGYAGSSTIKELLSRCKKVESFGGIVYFSLVKEEYREFSIDENIYSIFRHRIRSHYPIYYTDIREALSNIGWSVNETFNIIILRNPIRIKLSAIVYGKQRDNSRIAPYYSGLLEDYDIVLDYFDRLDTFLVLTDLMWHPNYNGPFEDIFKNYNIMPTPEVKVNISDWDSFVHEKEKTPELNYRITPDDIQEIKLFKKQLKEHETIIDFLGKHYSKEELNIDYILQNRLLGMPVGGG